MQVYIPPKQPFSLHTPASYAIVSTMTLKTAGGETMVPAVALQAIAAQIRRLSVIDDIRASVQITKAENSGHHGHDHDRYIIEVFFPRALVSYGTAGDVIPIYLPQIGERCADLAEVLTETFKRVRHSHAYTSTVQAMVAAINLTLLDGITHIHFDTFCYTSAPTPSSHNRH